MLKKVKKYLKFVVCSALMLSLMVPSYAALSASDGSAFVTKAEFDSALADFNARLTTFEAGINSKIDSQVTSYLDRNGIWSGKSQELTSLCYGGSLCDDTSTFFYRLCKASNSDGWAKSNAGTAYTGGWFSEQYKLIEKCNKTGLLYITWQINGFKGSNTTLANPTMNSKYYAYSWTCEGYERFYWQGYGLTTVKDSVDPKDYYGLLPWYHVTLVTTFKTEISATKMQFGQPNLSGDNLFFVDQGDSVYWSWLINSYATNGIWMYVEKTGNTAHLGDAFMHVLNAKIY